MEDHNNFYMAGNLPAYFFISKTLRGFFFKSCPIMELHTCDNTILHFKIYMVDMSKKYPPQYSEHKSSPESVLSKVFLDCD